MGNLTENWLELRMHKRYAAVVVVVAAAATAVAAS